MEGWERFREGGSMVFFTNGGCEGVGTGAEEEAATTLSKSKASQSTPPSPYMSFVGRFGVFAGAGTWRSLGRA
jgi:hypothetical protein